MKIHFSLEGPAVACRFKAKRWTALVSRVDCLRCQKTPEFIEVKAAADKVKQEAFDAQEPRIIREPWHQEVVYMVCKACGHNLFRYRGRSCMGHYEDHVCSRCGNVESRLTETGMSF